MGNAESGVFGAWTKFGAKKQIMPSSVALICSCESPDCKEVQYQVCGKAKLLLVIVWCWYNQYNQGRSVHTGELGNCLERHCGMAAECGLKVVLGNTLKFSSRPLSAHQLTTTDTRAGVCPHVQGVVTTVSTLTDSLSV